MSAWRLLQRSALVGLLDAVRNRILTFAIQLERIAPEAGERSVQQSSLTPSQVAPTFNLVIQGGSPNVAVRSTYVSQTQQTLVVPGDIAGLRAFLLSAGASEGDDNELQEIIEQEPRPQDKARRMLEFIGKMSAKAAEGVLKVGSESVTKAILSHYSLG